MAIRVYRLAVVGCPRSVIEPTTSATSDDGSSFGGVGKSCLCNRFIKPEAYTETHDSLVSAKKWSEDPAITGDHFLFWGATTRHLTDGSKARFQVVEQTEFYDKEASTGGEELRPHPSDASYLERATAVRIATSSIGKVAVRLKAEQASARAGGIRSTTQIFPNEDFGGKNGGVLGFACVFDPTLTGEQMKRQMLYLTELMQALNKRKKKLALACTKCDEASEEQIKLGAGLAGCVLKKPIPFFEVSSRDDVNVEDVFFSLIGHARKSPKLPRAPKSPKSTRHFSIGNSNSGYISYKDAVSLKKRDIRRAKDAYRRLIQKKITNFSAVWSEAYLMLEKEEEFSVLLQLAGKEGKDMVKNMFCLRLIEIKLTEGAKLYGMSSATKKLNKEKSQDYQRYLSDALKSHPDLRDESVYDYVYSTGMADTSSVLSHQTSISSENPSSSRSSQCITPDSNHHPAAMGGSAVHLRYVSQAGGQPLSATMPDLSGKEKVHQSQSAELLATHSPHPSPLPTRDSAAYNYSSNSQLPQSGNAGGACEKTRSQPLLDVTPPPPPLPIAQRLGLDRRRSNSMSRLESTPIPSAGPSNESVDALNAEPYLQPMEVRMVMQTLPRTHKIPESISVHSLHSDIPQKRQFPVQVSAVEISRFSMGESPRSFGHRRTASNPWVLEGGGEHHFAENPLPPLPPPPPVPVRDYQRPSKSPPRLDPDESSLDFPHSENRRSIASGSLSPKHSGTADRPQSHYTDIDDTDKLSTISGPFEEISDDPDSSTETSKTGENTPRPSVTSKTSVLKKKSSTLNSDYEKIEEYITMAPSSTFPRHQISHAETSPKRTMSGERSPMKTTGATPQKSKKGWTRQHTDSIIPDAATIRSSSPPLFPTRRFTMLDNPPMVSPSKVRPLPPSPSKSVTSPTKKVGVSKKFSTGSNIYETIDEELLNRVHPRRRGSALPKWVPPVDPKHHAQYMVILRKFFTNPQVIEAWGNTVREIIPGGDISTYPPPYSTSQDTKQSRKLGASVELPEPMSSTPNIVRQSRHERAGSHDQYVLPVSLLQPKTEATSSSTSATPAVPRTDGATGYVGFSSPREKFAARRPQSRENLIELLNMSAFQGDSSESESSESEESEDEEREEEDEESEEEDGVGVEEEDEESEVGEGVGVEEGEEKSEVGEGGGVEEGEGEGVEDTIDGEVHILQPDSETEQVEEEENDQKTSDATEETQDTPNSTVPQMSPDKGYHAAEDELDSIITSLNPILSAFDSILSDPADTTPLETTTTTSSDKPDSQTHDLQNHNPILRASVSTDSDLDSTSSLMKPSVLFSKRPQSTGGSRIMRWVSAFEQSEDQERDLTREKGKRGPPPPVTKRKPTRKREVATDGMSDSGISNCHSQTFDDGFNPWRLVSSSTLL